MRFVTDFDYILPGSIEKRHKGPAKLLFLLFIDFIVSILLGKKESNQLDSSTFAN